MVGTDGTPRSTWLVLATHVTPDGPDGGMVRYVLELLSALAERPDIDLEVLVRPESVARVTKVTHERARVRATRAGNVVSRSLMELLVRRRHDVVLGPKHLVPLIGIRGSVRALVVHDTMLFDIPGDFRLPKRVLLRLPFRRSIGAADLIVCNSETTRQRLCERFPRAAARSVAVPLAAATSLRNAVAERPRAMPEGPFALVVGDSSRRKNVDFVRRAWSAARELPATASLVLVGPPQARASAEADRQVCHLGFLTEAELRWCYENAAVVLCPSRLEGFGLPVAEAMAFSRPVVTSDDPAMVEVSGAGVRHLPADAPGDLVAWSRAIEEHLSHAVPADEGASRWARRDWDDVATETVMAVNAVRQGRAR